MAGAIQYCRRTVDYKGYDIRFELGVALRAFVNSMGTSDLSIKLFLT